MKAGLTACLSACVSTTVVPFHMLSIKYQFHPKCLLQGPFNSRVVTPLGGLQNNDHLNGAGVGERAWGPMEFRAPSGPCSYPAPGSQCAILKRVCCS